MQTTLSERVTVRDDVLDEIKLSRARKKEAFVSHEEVRKNLGL